MVKDHSDSETGNPLPPHGLLFPNSSKGSFICNIPDRITHTTGFGSFIYAPSHRQDSTHNGVCCTSCGALAGTRNSSMGPPWRIDPTTHRSISERYYHGATSRSLDTLWDNTIHRSPTDILYKKGLFIITLIYVWIQLISKSFILVLINGYLFPNVAIKICTKLSNIFETGSDGAVAKSSANGLVDTGFASRSRLIPRAGF